MIGVVIITHGKLAESFVDVIYQITGPQSSLVPLCIFPQDDMKKHREQFLKKIEELDDGDGVIVVTDLFGGTPSNLALSALGTCSSKVEVIAGVNLPLLVQLMTSRKNLPLVEVAHSAQEAGKKYIQLASALLEVDR